MKFGVEQCAVTVLKRNKHDSPNNDIIVENQDIIRSTDKNNCYKYLGILVLDNIKHQQSIRKRMRKTTEKNFEIKVEFPQPGDYNKNLSGTKNKPNKNLKI